jgi:hypothetical protein
MITGPLGLRFGERIMPRLETGEIAGYDLPTPSRVRQWFDLAPSIGGDLFLKLYTHGAAERNLVPLLNGGLRHLFTWLAEEADRRSIEIHWATAWQMYQAADALIHGLEPVVSSKKSNRTISKRSRSCCSNLPWQDSARVDRISSLQVQSRAIQNIQNSEL